MATNDSVPYTAEQRAQMIAQACEAHKRGLTWPAIAASMGIGSSTLRHWLQRARAAGEMVEDAGDVDSESDAAPMAAPSASPGSASPSPVPPMPSASPVPSVPPMAAPSASPMPYAPMQAGPQAGPQAESGAPFALPRYSPLAARLEAIEQLAHFEDRFYNATLVPAVRDYLSKITLVKERFWRLDWGGLVARLRRECGEDAPREIEFFRFVWLSVNGYVPVGFEGKGL